MSFNVTDRALAESERPKIEPQLVLEIEGVTTLFGAVTISRLIRIGDPGLLIGDAWRIGGIVPVSDQKQNVNFDSGTTTRIEQQLYPDKGSVSSISSAQIALNDENLIMTQIISPGIVVEDILGRKATLWMGFKNTAFKEDYVPIFSGVIDDVDSGSGVVKLNIASPQTLQRQDLFTPTTVTVDGTIGDTDDVVSLIDATKIPLPGIGPDGSVDPAIQYYIKVDDEIIGYTGVSGNNLTGCTRGQLATLAARHVVNQSTQIVAHQWGPTDPLILGTYFILWGTDGTKYYFWYKTIFATDPAIPDAVGVPYLPAGNNPIDIIAAIGVAIATLPAVFSGVISGPSILVTNVVSGKVSEPNSGNSGWNVATVDKGSDNIDAQTLVQIEDTSINCALKLMLSGVNDFYLKALPATRYLHPDSLTTVPNSIFFEGIDLNRDYGVVPGDFVTVTDAANGANNCSAKVIEDVVATEDGGYIIVEGVSFVTESSSTALVSIRSQYDTLGAGLALTPDQVDVLEHHFWRDYILGSYFYRFVIQDTIQGRDFLNQEVYLPIGAFSLPRQARCSMGYTVGPVVRGPLKTLSRDNIKDPDQIHLRRTINRNFYNSVVYQMDQTVGDTSAFVNNVVTDDEDSQNRIPVGNKTFVVASAGLRKTLGGFGIAEAVSTRWLARYRFAAEYFENIGILFREGYSIEPGDTVLFDPAGLKISETADGTRDKKAKLYTVVNKSLDLKTGDVKVSLTDTNFDATQRFGTVSPSSIITGGTTTSLKIKDSFGAIYPGNESKKWRDYAGLRVIAHSADWSRQEEVTLLGIDPLDSYTLLLDPTTPLGSVPTNGMILDIASYPQTGTDPNEDSRYKAVHAFLSATVAVVSGADGTHFDVDMGDVAKFAIKGPIRIHNKSFSHDSGDNVVLGISGTTIETKNPIGFTPDSTCVVELMPFADGGSAYRIF